MNHWSKLKLRLSVLGFGLLSMLAGHAAPLAISAFDSTGRLTFNALPGATAYRVEWTTNLLTPAWNSNAPGLPQILGPGSGSLTVTAGIAHASCFYRVVATVTNQLPAAITSTFETDAQNWLIVDYPFHSHAPNPAMSALPHDAAFGNPPGSVRVADVYGETGIAAPAEYLGDKLAFYGGSLVYDIYVRFTDGVTYPAVVLNGGTRSLYYDAPSPPLNAWQHNTVPLSEAGWKVSGTQVSATAADFQTVLSNLAGIYIYSEWNTGQDDTNLDNIRLTPP